jgi:hypothetical protein
MKTTVCGALAVSSAILISTASIHAQRNAASHPDLQGTWIGSTLTPLQRPPEFKDRASLTPEEAAEYVRTSADRIRARLPTELDRLTQADVDADYVETEVIKLDGLRTSLIVDPPNGMLPPLLPAAQARIAARPKRTYEDPETFNLAERCLLGNFGLGGSAASPPLLPSVVAAYYHQIVQTDDYVLMFGEWVHDARIIRMNGTHLAPSIKKWLGDSIGHWEGSTLVVDTTNFRPEIHNVDSGERLHVVERFIKVDAQTIRYRVTVEDPDTWATPWTAEWPFKATDSKIYEMACHEGNYAIQNFLRGARAEEQRQATPR